jgi:hypothetical protein
MQIEAEELGSTKMLAHTYRLRVAERIRQLALLTVIGALLNVVGPRLLAHGSERGASEPTRAGGVEVPVVAPVVGSGEGGARTSEHLSPVCEPAHGFTGHSA